MTRTHNKHLRVFVDGYDLSGQSRQIGSLDWSFGADPDAAFADEAKNITIGQCDIQAGTLNAFLENDAAQLFALAAASQGTRNLMVAIGLNAPPVAGNPVFAWQFEDVGYKMEPGSGFVAANLPFGGASYASTLTYRRPWGYLLHPKGAETAVNTAVGLDDNGAASALGGIFIYHILSADGTATVKMQDAATNSNGSFADLAGATSGSVDASLAPKHGMVALSPTATVRRYTRPQIVLGTATTLTYVSAFIRNNLPAL